MTYKGLIPNQERPSATFLKELPPHLELLAVMNKPAGYRDRAPDRVDGVAPLRVLVQQGQHEELSAGECAVLDEVVRLHMVLPLCPQPDAGPVVQTEPPSFGLLFRHLQAFLTPDAFHSLVIHVPSFHLECSSYSWRSVPAVYTRNLDDPLCQRLLVVTDIRQVTLGCSRLPEHLARPPLGDAQRVDDMVDRIAFPARA